MSVPLIILIVIIVAIVGFVILLYNGLIQRRLRVDEAFAQIEVQLKRRHDLIPNLVDAVKGYMDFEQKVLTDVTNARADAVAAGAQGPAAQAQAENVLTGALRSLFAVVENYPQLKANENVLSLQEQLTTTENQIGFSRQHYNATVLDYNTGIQTFPAVLIAGMFGFTKRDFFDAEAEADGPERRPGLRLDGPGLAGRAATGRSARSAGIRRRPAPAEAPERARRRGRRRRPRWPPRSTARSPPTSGTRSCSPPGSCSSSACSG